MTAALPDVVIPKALAGPARDELIEGLYRVHCEIFDGVDRDAFVHYVVDSPAEETWIKVHRDGDRVIGYFAAHLFRRTIEGRPSIVLRGETGMLREHRGGGTNRGFAFTKAARVIAANPGVPVYYLGCLIHPSSYYNTTKYCRPMWPSRDHAPDAGMLATMVELGDSFGLERVGDHPLVRHVGWRTRDTEAERAYWLRSDKPDVRFFVETNPGYGEGHGLLTLVPMTPALIGTAVSRIAREKGGRGVEDLAALARRAPIASRWLMPAEVRRRLRALALFEGLDEPSIAALAARAEVVTRPAGSALMKEGQAADALFVIEAGAVHVHLDRQGEEVLLDQLDAGDVVGEIGILSGEPRTASARTATRCTLIRLERQALLDAMAVDRALSDALWSRYTARRFDQAARRHPVLARMTRASRAAFLRQGRAFELEAGAQRAIAGAGFLFLARGEARVEHRGVHLTARAPVLLERADEVRLEALSALHAIELPSPPPPGLAELFREHPRLDGLSEADLAALIDAAAPVRLERDQVLFEAGDRADALYLICAGAVDVTLGDEVLARLGAGEVLGERGLDPEGPGVRTASVRAIGPTELLRVKADVALRVAGRSLFGRAVDDPDAGRSDQLTRELGATWASAPPREVEQRRIPAGEILVREDEPADAAYYLVEGVARVEQGSQVIGRVHPGECFGERAVLLETRRSASVIAETEVVVNRVPAGEFLRWSRAQPRLGDLLETLAQIHRSSDGARATMVYRGAYDGHPCVTSLTPLAEGRSFAAIKLADQPVLILSTDDGGGPATDAIEFERAPVGSRRRLEFRGDRPVSVRIEGDLGTSVALGERLRNGKSLTRGELERFRWTGRLGAPASGADRLVCGCVGVTRRDLTDLQAAGCASADVVRQRTGAGSVCGGCAPLVRRLLGESIIPDGDARHPDEVDLESFEARLDGLRHVDAARCVCGPETITWRVNGETVALLGGLRALLLQFAHPAAQALVEHSTFTTDSGQRLHRTLETMYSLAFGEGATMLRLAREIHEKHARVVGRYDESRGPHRAGDRYAANQIDLLVWTALTVVDTSVCTYEALVGPLTLGEKDQLVREASDLFGLFGIPKDRFPADWAAFRTRFDGMVSSGTLHVGRHARALGDATLRAPRLESEGLYWALRRLTARWLPEPLRAGFGLDDGPIARASGAALERAIRAAVPRMPRAIRYSPARLHAERRLAGDAGPAPEAVRLERALAFALGVDPARLGGDRGLR